MLWWEPDTIIHLSDDAYDEIHKMMHRPVASGCISVGIWAKTADFILANALCLLDLHVICLSGFNQSLL